MPSFTLYGNRESGHTYKVALMLRLAGIEYDYHEIDLDLPRQVRPEPFRSMAKYGEVPLLVHEGVVFVQSNAILAHLAEHTGTFGGESRERMDRVRDWLFWEANRIGFSLPNLRYAMRFPDTTEPAVERMLRARFDADIARLDLELADGRAFILGAQPTVADCSLCGYIWWPDQAKVAYPPDVQAWLARIAALPGWRHPYEIHESQ
jgi:glutathione S-transferase